MTAQPDEHTQVSHDPNPAPQAGCAKEGWLTGALAGLDERLDRLFLKATDGERFVLSKDSARNIVEIAREWLRNRLPAPPVAESGWQEIESAPKDDLQEKLVFSRDGNRHVAIWSTLADDFVDTMSGCALNAQLWMPLPAPPHIAEEQTGAK